MKKKAPPKRKKGARRGPQNHNIKVGFALLFVLGFLLLALIGLSHFRETYRPQYLEQYEEVTEKYAANEVRVTIESALIKNGFKLHSYKVRPQGNRIVFEVQGDFPAPQWIGDLKERLKTLSQDIRVHFSADRKVVSVDRGKGVPFYLYFYPLKHFPVPQKRVQVVIIMDDLGRDLDYAGELLKLDFPVTFSILPYVPKASATAALAHEHGREVLLHIPMEPRSFPAANPGKNALFVNLPAAEINRRFAAFLEKVPFAVGGNNHMGSRFTEHKGAMEVVLDKIKKEGLFYVDSLTSAQSVGYVTAREMHVPVAVRDVFLDNVRDVDTISSQIARLADLAEKKGHAIGICHPYGQTLEALQKAQTLFKERKIEVVNVSGVLEK
ncbi:MAG: divergent polysaccharide deacetylase family protein [Deltaproteobacteria bacterium]|nr:divergent polysaccharide deacetylase family protein [Deltaproteobacteria bacterium]